MPHTVGLIPMKAKAREIQSAYERAAANVLSVLSNLDPLAFTAVEFGAALRQVQGIVLTLNDTVRAWAPTAIRAAYNESADIASTRLELIGARRLPERRYDPARHDRKIDALARFVARDFFRANMTIEKTAKQFLGLMSQSARGIDRILAQTQEFDPDQVKDFIKRTVRSALTKTTIYNEATAHLTSKDVSARIRAMLAKKIGGGDFIAIRGKDGVTRNYNLSDYSDLVARTRMREAQTEAVKETSAQYGGDLVQIAKHDHPCDECADFQGNVYSISGKSDQYPELPDGGPPFHPRCECTANPTSETALAWRGR